MNNDFTPLLDKKVFTIAFSLTCIFIFLLAAFPQATATKAQWLQAFLTSHLGWLFLLAGITPLALCIWLALGRYSNVKFGSKDEQPEYSNLSWAAMMFATSIGASLIAWGFAEPIFYLDTPPLGIEPHSKEAIEWAHAYPLYHWSLIPWAMYCLPGLPIAYMLFKRNKKILRISDSCAELLPANPNISANIIDIFVMLGIVGGVATSIGFGVPLVSSLLAKWLGIADDLTTQIGVIILWTMLFSFSAYRGLKKGIKVLSDINIIFVIIFMVFILIAGPTLFILNISVNSIGLLIDNLIQMSLWTDPVAKSANPDNSTFPENWTMFYWAWWFAYAPMMGLFFGRISRGRTIRQYIFGVLGFGALGTITFLCIAGAYVLYLDTFTALDASAILNDSSISSASRMSNLVAIVISQLPFSEIVLALVVVLSIIFYATTFDSSAYILASINTTNLDSTQEPARWNRLVWALSLGAIATGLMIAESFAAIKAITVILSIPSIIILFMMVFTMLRWLQQDYPPPESK